MTNELKVALNVVSKLVAPYVEERNDVLHEGRRPQFADYEWESHWIAAEGKPEAEFFKALAEGAASDRLKIAAKIDAEVAALKNAEEGLTEVMWPVYLRHHEMLSSAPQ